MAFAKTVDYLLVQKLLGKKVLLCFSNITANKNQIQIVRIMEKGIDDSVVLLLGKELDGGSIRDFCISHKLYEKVIIGGFCSEIPSIISDVDLNIFPSLNDGFGLPIIEGFKYGIPCVAFSDLDAISDVYSDNAMLLSFNHSDEALKETIEQALNVSWNKELILKHSKAFSLEGMAEKYNEIYKKSIGC